MYCLGKQKRDLTPAGTVNLLPACAAENATSRHDCRTGNAAPSPRAITTLTSPRRGAYGKMGQSALVQPDSCPPPAAVDGRERQYEVGPVS